MLFRCICQWAKKQCFVIFDVAILKEKRPGKLLFFQIARRTKIKTKKLYISHLVCHIWFLVTGWYNERSNYLPLLLNQTLILSNLIWTRFSSQPFMTSATMSEFGTGNLLKISFKLVSTDDKFTSLIGFKTPNSTPSNENKVCLHEVKSY